MHAVPLAALDLTPGTLYASQIHNRHNRCRVVCLAQSIHSQQEVVVYQIMGGPDSGHFKCCPTATFALKFQRVPAAEATVQEEVVADMGDKGKGF